MNELNKLIIKALNSANRVFLGKDLLGKTLTVREFSEKAILSFDEFEQLEKLGIAEKRKQEMYSFNTDETTYIDVYELKYSKMELELFGINLETEDFSNGLDFVLDEHRPKINEFVERITVDERTKREIQEHISKNDFKQYDGIFTLIQNGYSLDTMELVIEIENMGKFILRKNGIIIPMEIYKENIRRVLDVRIQDVILDSIGIYSLNDSRVYLNDVTKKYEGNSYVADVLNEIIDLEVVIDNSERKMIKSRTKYNNCCICGNDID